MTLDTIYSVGEGRTVVVAVDGCMGCLNAFEEFIKDKAEPDDRVVVVVKGGRGKPQEGTSTKFMNSLSLASGPRALAMSLLSGQRLRSPAPSGATRLAERPECKLRNRVVVPGKPPPLADFGDWDRSARATLGKLATRAEPHSTRFEAMRVPAGARSHWTEAVMECCTELDANLLVVASHKQPKGPHARSLSAVFSVNPDCPVLVLGRKTPPEQTVEPPEDEEEEEDGEGEGSRWRLRKSTSSIGKSFSKSASFGTVRRDSQDFPNPMRVTGGLSRTLSGASKGRRRPSDDMEVPRKQSGDEVLKRQMMRPGSHLMRRESSAPGRMQASREQMTLSGKVRVACQKAVDAPKELLTAYFTP